MTTENYYNRVETLKREKETLIQKLLLQTWNLIITQIDPQLCDMLAKATDDKFSYKPTDKEVRNFLKNHSSLL